MEAREGAFKLLSDVQKQAAQLQKKKRREKLEKDRTKLKEYKVKFNKEQETFLSDQAQTEQQHEILLKELKERQSSLLATRELFNQERRNFEESASRLAQEEKFIKDNVLASTQLLKINVGGKRFLTTNAIVVTNPRSKDSMLAAMFSGRFTGGLQDEDGYSFIDRDPEPFEHILTFLRSGYVPTEKQMPRTGMKWIQIMHEVEFYGLRSWQEYIVAREVAENLKLPLRHPSLEDLLKYILHSSNEKLHIITRLTAVHYASYKANFATISRIIEDHILDVIGNVILENQKNAKIKLPLTIQSFEEFIVGCDMPVSDSSTRKILLLVRKTMEHAPQWQSALGKIQNLQTMSASPNAVITKDGLLVTKNQSGNSWNCGVIAEEALPCRGRFEWSVRLLASCNNLMIGISKKIGFKTTAANYSGSTGHYLYCFNGCLYGLHQHHAWQNIGAINSGSVVKVKCNMDAKQISFDLDGVDKGVAFDGIDVSVPLFAAFDLYDNGCSFEIISE